MMAGGLGHIRHSDIIPLMLANAGRLARKGSAVSQSVAPG